MYLSAKEAALRKGVTPAAIYAAFESGLLPYEIIAGKKVTTEAALKGYHPIFNHARAGRKLRRPPRPNKQENTNQ